MRKLAALSAVVLVGLGTLTATGAEARGGGALAAGIIGGLAAGALLGAAASEARPAPGYGYGYAPPPAYEPAPVVTYRPARTYVEEDVPVYRPRYVHRVYEDYPPPPRYRYGYGYGW